MPHSNVFVACILFTVVLANSSKAETNSDVKVTVGENISELSKKNPHMKILQQPNRQSEIKNVGVTYQLGSRLPGDHLVAKIHGDQIDLLPFPTVAPSSEKVSGENYEPFVIDEDNSPKNLTLTVTYPRTGLGALITFVQIKVVQTSPIGQCSVISGGILQRHISILIEAKETNNFRFSGEVYGI